MLLMTVSGLTAEEAASAGAAEPGREAVGDTPPPAPCRSPRRS
jgi:hypothetical protein